MAIEHHEMGEPRGEGVRHQSTFFIGIIYDGVLDNLRKTINSITRQNYSSPQLDLKVFYEEGQLPSVKTDMALQYIAFESQNDFFQKFANSIESSKAEYCTVFNSGDCFFDHSIGMVNRVFEDYPVIDWLTGIQTLKSANGFNVIFGSLATRRWNYGIFERNLYKNSSRYIPPGSTFWRKSLWKKAGDQLYFVSAKSFYDDLWLGFFKAAELYTSNIYFSSTWNYEVKKMKESSKSIQYPLIEDGFLAKAQEFFFLNNIPYLRLFYKRKNKLVPVIRYDHKLQSCFLNDY
ncbi:MAG: hypothetical protein JWO06_1810 [Bacteroidota bacterium]|nr:hypothetical protein [Bacteroidota bacterium]